jgi:transposase
LLLQSMPARYVRAYFKTNKHGAADADSCRKAVQRPRMRFGSVEGDQPQGMLMVHRTRDLLVRQRTAAANALRGHFAEFGTIAAKGTAKARELMSLVGTDEHVPAIARDALLQLVKQIRNTQGKIEAFDKQILSLARKNEVCRRFDKRADHRAVCHHRIDGDGRQSSLVRLRSRLCTG